MSASTTSSLRTSKLVFYEEASPDKALRFGDVVRGYVSLTPIISTPILGLDDSEYTIDVRFGLCAILSPCCSIRDHVLALAPLKKVPQQYLQNEYLATDLTNINRPMEPCQALPRKRWAAMDEAERQERIKQGRGYAFLEEFVYGAHGLLPDYEVHISGKPARINHYMIDFRDTFHVNCQAIDTPQRSPLKCKILQLSMAARQELRDKIANYYQRVPKEELALVI